MIIYRHKKTNKVISGKTLATDDFGNLWYECRYTKKPVNSQECIFIGAVLPQVNCTYVCAKDAMDAFKYSKAALNEMDANCNTCKFLERLAFQKQSPASVMHGVCNHHPYKIKVTFHPDDHMSMKCWKAR